MNHVPEILSPAGDAHSLLAALSAGADAVYLGLKHFSARMQAENFSVGELARLVALARSMDRKVYVAMNTFLKPGEEVKAGRLMDRLARSVKPHALIIQDLGAADVARQAGFEGELHLSTLANVSSPTALAMMPSLGISRVVLPRELNVDEMRQMAEACPEGVSLETFVHGALCHNVSGRCWWSSFLGGKSGLRGRCVQPCRRVFARKGMPGRYFSCQDLSLDVLAKALLTMPQVKAWKIEGRKKGPHYVYYVTTAYRILRDAPDDPHAKKAAMDYLGQALGRPATHYTFLPQKPRNPVDALSQTGSGQMVGRLSMSAARKYFVNPRQELLPGDLLRLGYEDEPGHQVVRISRHTPKSGRYDLTLAGKGKERPRAGMSVFLIDRREPELMRRIQGLEDKLRKLPDAPAPESTFEPVMPKPFKLARGVKPESVHIWRQPPKGPAKGAAGVWVSATKTQHLPLGRAASTWWWLPPVVWPNEEKDFLDILEIILKRGGKRFVLNAPWQLGLMGRKRREMLLWSGPFANVTNVLALGKLRDMGFDGAVVSPELSGAELLALPKQSPLPLGIVTHGLWPLGVSRTMTQDVKSCEPIVSPKGEICFVTRYGQNFWIYPNWEMDLREKEEELARAGYVQLIHLREPMPASIERKERGGVFNWDIGVL
ncbi:putative protease YdcP [Fundidesulfovibrio magnetotacticus]|uniref:Putative protease YdcP n=1 Tax=Fundidesulfovibrio magnetotacticus TaxID=2730080 RepID=A0A6V8M0U7_9BACT|nr:U32 family peptidase [Fundidesulfovibrio magnetotacticus]GFK96068.1 putative protease YdcP [Fundidesulfovibrio magnetotacticus]